MVSLPRQTKAIFFDLGGVLLNFDSLINRVLEVFQPADKDKFWDLINIEAIPLCKGEMNILQFWKRVADRLGKRVPDHVLRNLWIKGFEEGISINEGVLSIIKSLKPNYKLGLISNTISEDARIVRRLGIFDLFDDVILSYEVHLTKDQEEIFLLAINRLGIKAQESVFIDDIEKFTEVAKSVGMVSIHFINAEKLKRDLRQANINV
jgi:putative hydrolase of the HAD superfamily